jgi:hypothetical protein
MLRGIITFVVVDGYMFDNTEPDTGIRWCRQ